MKDAVSKYDLLEGVPERLLALAIAGVGRSFRERVASLQELHRAVSEGDEPNWDIAKWPTGAYVRTGWDTLRGMDVLRFAASSEEIALEITCALVEDSVAALGAENERLRHDLERIAALREEVRQDAQVNALYSARQASARDLQERQNQRWFAVCQGWKQIDDVLGDLGAAIGLGWDLSRGAFARYGIEAAARLKSVLDRSEQLKDIIRLLGRERASDDGRKGQMIEVVREVVERVATVKRVWTANLPTEARSLHRSADIARMLPTESVLFARKTTRLLWYARLAERALNTYLLEGTELVTAGFEDKTSYRTDLEAQKSERGPILVCVDTSGSMRGSPETIAKALTLACASAAHRQARGCFLYAFGSTNEVAEHELDLKPSGLESLLGFLAGSFGGGTDPSMALTRAAERTRESKWKAADILVVSDGEFGVPTHAIRDLDLARKEQDLEVVGVLVGNSSAPSMEAVCDRLHRFSDWDALR